MVCFKGSGWCDPRTDQRTVAQWKRLRGGNHVNLNPAIARAFRGPPSGILPTARVIDHEQPCSVGLAPHHLRAPSRHRHRLTFGVSALYTGIAGALGGIVVQFVAPDSFTFALSVALFVGLVVGGVGSIAGTLFGAWFVLFVPNIAEHISKGLAGAVYGIMLVLLIYLMPSGLAGLVRLVLMRFAQAKRG